MQRRRNSPCGPTAVSCVVLLLGACKASELIPTPNLFLDTEENPFADVPEHFQNNEVDVMYVTDRRPVTQEDGSLSYDHGRSYSMAFGSAIVEIGEQVPWETLVTASRTDDRDVELPLQVTDVTELGRYPQTPFPNVAGPDGLTVPDPAVLAENEATAERMVDELRRRLALTPTKEAYLYIHGYNNSFDYTVSVIGQIWHFLGRRGVPIAYTWPAGIGGMRGYFYDRESGEFTVYHLKQFLGQLLRCDELERLHIIAHSRGTDVSVTAIRELFLEMKHDFPQEDERKLGNLILAAPDMDIDVISQRLMAEDFMKYVHRLTVYMSTTDAALGFSTWLFVSGARVGRISPEEMPEAMQHRSRKNVALVDAAVSSGFIGHSYFYSHPAVSSDLILLLRDDCGPGEANGRPLEHRGQIYWRIDNSYPHAPPRALEVPEAPQPVPTP